MFWFKTHRVFVEHQNANRTGIRNFAPVGVDVSLFLGVSVSRAYHTSVSWDRPQVPVTLTQISTKEDACLFHRKARLLGSLNSSTCH